MTLKEKGYEWLRSREEKKIPVFGEVSELDYGWIVMWIHANHRGWGRALVLKQGHFTPEATKVGSVGKFLWDRERA